AMRPACAAWRVKRRQPRSRSICGKSRSNTTSWQHGRISASKYPTGEPNSDPNAWDLERLGFGRRLVRSFRRSRIVLLGLTLLAPPRLVVLFRLFRPIAFQAVSAVVRPERHSFVLLVSVGETLLGLVIAVHFSEHLHRINSDVRRERTPLPRRPMSPTSERPLRPVDTALVHRGACASCFSYRSLNTREEQ